MPSGKLRTGIVAGCNYYVGISVVAKDDKNFMLVCLNNKTHKEVLGENKYKEIFDYTVSDIKKGEIDIMKAVDFESKLGHDGGPNPTAENCPFR